MLKTISALQILINFFLSFLIRLILSFLLLALLIALPFVPRAWRRQTIVPLVWLAVVAVVMQFHEPLWYHHSLLMTIPAAWCAAMFAELLWEQRTRSLQWRRAMIAALLVLGCLEAGKFIFSVRHRMFVVNSARERQVVEEMRRRAPQTTWAMCDRLMYPFEAGLLVPPEVAVMSTKRRAAGKLPDESIVRTLDQYKPEQVFFTRIDFGPSVNDYLAKHYRVARQYDINKPSPLYVRRDSEKK